MNKDRKQQRLLGVVSLASEYCMAVEQTSEMEKDEFVMRMLTMLPRLYHEFFDLVPEGGAEEYYAPSYLEEEQYESVRRRMETLFGEDDTFLQTFEEDMKYSDTPISSSVSESLADIYQALYNFVSICRETDGADLEEAFADCREKFELYWSRVLCVVMCALNNIKFFSN